MRQRLERYFEFEALGTNWRTELLAGVTTFVTMAYIIFVNPSILQDAGMPFAAVIAATCLASAVGSLLMGGFARYPIALASALIIVGCLMISHIGEIDWSDPVVSVPAFLTMITIPLTFSIANGIAFGFTAYTLLKVLRGEFRKVNWLVYVLTALFIARFLYLGAS
jgi:xanthine/uracil/vitamin C permease (AzgA family)